MRSEKMRLTAPYEMEANMLRLLVLITSAFVSAAAPALAEPRKISGTKDGVSYEGTAELQANGNVELRGVYTATRDKFRLTVTPRGRVNGRVGYSSVKFDVDRPVYSRLAASLARPVEVAGIDR